MTKKTKATIKERIIIGAQQNQKWAHYSFILGARKMMKTKKFGNLEITKVLHKGKCFNDIKIPNGFKLLTMQDVADTRNNPEVIKWVDGYYFFIEQPIKEYVGKYACSAWLGCDGDNFSIDADYDLDNDDAARGVIFKKVKK